MILELDSFDLSFDDLIFNEFVFMLTLHLLDTWLTMSIQFKQLVNIML